MNQKFNTIVIDGDMLAYLAAFPTQTERWFVRDNEGDVVIDYPTLESCQNYLQKKDLLISDYVVNKETIVHKNWDYIALKVLFNKVNTWKSEVGASNAIIVLGDDNFRDNLPLLYNKYKDRDSSKKPLMLSGVRDLLRANFNCKSLPLYEADDLISMAQYRRS